ncbi:hypothetical protein [Draconibacterium halophilum]|uniref:Uncharacterized protein n=1 Tax=Draconibacterium halophilum TaxID=2706887 RepID=A0A6C0RH71_9BACT|nr:hypothetical protein [Draconibacterium halophilum]QIA09346.1 hypothetical protein G0Q07_17255 [Draconibacterium halophilum]
MKTKNNVQKTTSKILALSLILVVLGFSVNAQNLGKSLPITVSFKGMALAMVDNTVESRSLTTEADVHVSNFDVETEEALRLEDWMTDEASFDVYAQYVKTEQEEALEVEDWMIDEATFNHWSFQFAVEAELPLELEDWMTSDEVWKR